MSRGQSTVVGTILLVAVVVLGVTLFGFFSLASVTDAADGPVVDVAATLTSTGLTLTHGGGDSLPAQELVVIVRNDSTSVSLPFEAEALGGDGDGLFEPGERWTNTSTLPDGHRLTIIVVHEPSNAVLFDGTKERTAA